MDFILVSVPLLLLTVSIMGVAINGFARNVAQDIAIDSARFGALADQNASAARVRAQGLLAGPLLRLFRSDVSATSTSSSAGCRVQVSVSIKTIGFGLLSEALLVEEKASAPCEIQE